MGCSYNEYHVDFKGALSQDEYDKYICAAENYIPVYGLNDDIKGDRFALYEIVDYMDSNQVSGVFKSESADGYSYTRFDSFGAEFENSIASCVRRWAPRVFFAKWI